MAGGVPFCYTVNLHRRVPRRVHEAMREAVADMATADTLREEKITGSRRWGCGSAKSLCATTIRRRLCLSESIRETSNPWRRQRANILRGPRHEPSPG